jgi:hypothetical protein
MTIHFFDSDSVDATSPDDELTDLMNDYDLDPDTAERVREIMDETGLDEDEAVALEEEI